MAERSAGRKVVGPIMKSRMSEIYCSSDNRHVGRVTEQTKEGNVRTVRIDGLDRHCAGCRKAIEDAGYNLGMGGWDDTGIFAVSERD